MDFSSNLFSLNESSSEVRDKHLGAALHELVMEGGMLTQKVLGFGPGEKPK